MIKWLFMTLDLRLKQRTHAMQSPNSPHAGQGDLR